MKGHENLLCRLGTTHDMRQTALGKRYVSRDQVFIRKDGSTFPASVYSSPILENEKVVASVTAFRDITGRKRIEQEREQLIDKLQKALAEIKTLPGTLPICSNSGTTRAPGPDGNLHPRPHEHRVQPRLVRGVRKKNCARNTLRKSRKRPATIAARDHPRIRKGGAMTFILIAGFILAVFYAAMAVYFWHGFNKKLPL